MSNVYLVIEHEGMEDGTIHTSVLCAYHDRTSAERDAASHNGGRYMSWTVEEVELRPAHNTEAK
jgi:hypothetical protein